MGARRTIPQLIFVVSFVWFLSVFSMYLKLHQQETKEDSPRKNAALKNIASRIQEWKSRVEPERKNQETKEDSLRRNAAISFANKPPESKRQQVGPDRKNRKGREEVSLPKDASVRTAGQPHESKLRVDPQEKKTKKTVVTLPISAHHPAQKHNKNPASRKKKKEKTTRFLIFQGDQLKGQGAGNLMNGLLAAHLLGDEFGRMVCVTPAYKSFHMAFDAINAQECSRFFQTHGIQQDAVDVSIVNFRDPPSECTLQTILNNPHQKAVYLEANTYPRWPSVPPNYFFRFYKIKPNLLNMLPYNNSDSSPSVVVHLRQGDEFGDKRSGLDDISLQALGEYLAVQQQSNQKPYLITNHVPWFEWFQERFGWQHPDWQTVWHSALLETWGKRKTNHDVDLGKEWNKKKFNQYTPQDDVQSMQLWADWVILLMARQVYHTHSDFSLSAIHWMGDRTTLFGTNGEPIIYSRTINGVEPKTGCLLLDEEYWVKEEKAPRLIDRHGDQLHHCHSDSSSSDSKD